MLGITRRAAVLGAAADGHPARLFKGGEPGFCLPSVAEALRFGALWQDAAGSTPGAVGSTVGRMGFIAGLSSIASQGTATKRPLLTTDSKSIPLLRFDGIDDCLVTPSVDFSACEAVTVIAGIRKDAGTAAATLLGHGADAGNAGAVFVYCPIASTFSGEHFVVSIGGSTSAGGYYSLAPTLAGAVVAQVFVAGESTRRSKLPACVINGNTTLQSSAVNGADPFGAATFLNSSLCIGQRNSASLPFNGDLYSLTVIGRRLSNAEMLATSRWINEQMGRVY